MTLVERFIEIESGPTNRKVLLAAGAGVPTVMMQGAVGPLNQRWESAGIPETLQVRMGVNTGIVTVGNFGSAERTKYTALGKQVNVAARIQAQCEPGKVLISHPTWLLVRDQIPCTPKGELTLKGLHKPMPAYEVQT